MFFRTLPAASWLAIAAIILGGVRCRRNEPGAASLKVVSSLPRTGSANQQTTPMVNGIRMALEDATRAAMPVQLVYEDWDDASTRRGDWDPEVEAANAGRAAADQDVVVYLGPYNSGAAKISMPILNRAHLAMISVATYPGLTKEDMGEASEPAVYRPSGNINFFRIAPADDIQGRLGAGWMARMGAQSVFVLDDQGLYGRGLADVFVGAAEDVGLRILGRDAINPRAQEYRSLMARIATLSPDWVYFGGTTQTNAGQVIKDLVASGMTAKILLPDACLDDALILAAGATAANDRVFATFGGLPADHLTGAGAAFVSRYRQRFATMPEAYAVYGYVSAQAALTAIAHAQAENKKDRDAIRRALFEVRQAADSPLGDWSFTPSGDTTLQWMSGSRVHNGHFEFVTMLPPP